MSYVKKRLSDQQRAERRRADREFAREAVQRLRTSEGWHAWLASRRHFHQYTLGNQLLIAMQRPDATRVAGFRAWLKLGYAVRRGQQAIRIWAPIPPSRTRVEQWVKAGSNPDEKPCTYFKLAPVFDREQVQALPAPARPVPLDPPVREIDGDELAPVLPCLVELARQIGSQVVFEAISGQRRGYYVLESRLIAVSQDISPNAQVKTLIHELSHALLRAEPGEGDRALERPEEELVVELVAFTVCGSLGLDTSGYSIPFLASWAERGDIDTIERMAGLIDRLARRIENATTISENREL